jgi:hypothetical protein|tara:strand:- start:475 stop:618 length:144 start_codon:yes stop_codon:yes gene_type:complete
MSFGEYNGGDEATLVKAIIFLVLLGVGFGLIWLFGLETKEIPTDMGE